MNKYQEALENIIVYPLKEECENSPCCQCENQCDFYKMKLHDYAVLKELVDRATPKKPLKRYYTEKYGNNGKMKRVDIRCPHCNSYLTNGTRTSLGVYASREKAFIETVSDRKYCSACSQAIDWSDEE